MQKPLKFLLHFVAGVFTIREFAEFLRIALEAHAEHEHIAPGWLGEALILCQVYVADMNTAALFVHVSPTVGCTSDTMPHYLLGLVILSEKVGIVFCLYIIMQCSFLDVGTSGHASTKCLVHSPKETGATETSLCHEIT